MRKAFEARRHADNSAPTTRKGNPKQIPDWDDLGRAGIALIIPKPKTSGNGRYTYLAAWRQSPSAEREQ